MTEKHNLMNITQFGWPPYSWLLLETPVAYLEGIAGINNYILPCGRILYANVLLDVFVLEDHNGGGYLTICGLVLDLHKNTKDMCEIARTLLNELNTSEESFLTYLDYVGGRYIAIFRRSAQSSVRIVGDASNMLKVNYREVGGCCGSNIFLIDDILNKGSRVYRDSYLKQNMLWQYGCLGDDSPLDGVKILTPNHVLDLDSSLIRRFYPRKVIDAAHSISAAADCVLDLCLKQQDLLFGSYSLIGSLTAGLDSRFSLALSCVRKSELSFFTYLFKDAHFVDAVVASEIASSLGLKHVVLTKENATFEIDTKKIRSPLLSFSSDPDFIAELFRWSWHHHGKEIVSAYRQAFGNSGDGYKRPLHIRSNLFEIGRVFWGTRDCSEVGDILEISRPDWAGQCPKFFEDYFDRNDIDSKSVFGLNLLDVFYWEHRCGTWVPEVLQESDFAFNTHCYMNCRAVIEAMLSLPFEDRLKGSLFKHVIATKLGQIAHLPVNPRFSEIK